MKKIIKLIPLFLCFSFVFALSSCVNSIGSSIGSENKTVVFHGCFSIEEAFINQNSSYVISARSAQPTIPDDADLTYYAKATNGSEIIISEDIKITDKTFSIPLKTGSIWTIEVGAKGASAVDISVNDAILLKDSVVFNPNTPDEDEPTKEYICLFLTPNACGYHLTQSPTSSHARPQPLASLSHKCVPWVTRNQPNNGAHVPNKPYLHR